MRPDTWSFYARAVQRAIEQIVSNLDRALDLETLAADAALSPFHFHRIFRGMVGETPLELTRRLRLERAAWTLATDGRPVTEVAFDAGYDTHEAFTRAFRAVYDTSPSGFRRRARPSDGAACAAPLRIEVAAKCGVHFDARGGTPVFIPCDSGGAVMDVVVKEMPALRVATVRHIGPYNQISQAFQRVGALAGPAGLLAHAEMAMLGIYYDDPETTPPEQLRSDAAVVVPEGVALPEGLVEQRIPGGRYASTAHVGPYEHLGDAWARFMGEWLPASGNRLGTGASYEIYRNTPGDVPKEQLQTEMFMPLA